jgi:pyruvate, water dikinase
MDFGKSVKSKQDDMKMIYKFDELDNSSVKEVGGKNASLGEMFKKLKSKGIGIPDGFATSAEAYWNFINDNNIGEPLKEVLGSLDKENGTNLKEVGKKCRELVMRSSVPKEIKDQILQAHRDLKQRESSLRSMAVRSSATAEDLPDASFAGQHESFLNIRTQEELMDSWKKCVASLFTDRAIKYRNENGFDHMKVALSVGVQKMVRSDKASAGVAFTLDPDSGHRNFIMIDGAWGLGENVVQGKVRSDEFYLFKESLKNNKKSIVGKNLGSKSKMMVYAGNKKNGETIRNKETPMTKRDEYVLTDKELEKLGRWCLEIEELYDRPMDIEWAKDGDSNDLYIVQARPETVHSNKGKSLKLKKFNLRQDDKKPVLTGVGIGNKIAAGKARILKSPDESDKLKEGEVLVTEVTNPDWDPVLKKASAIVTNSGGRTSHAAIVARELGAVAVVGTNDATDKIKDGQEITVSCTDGDIGNIYDGILEWKESEIDLEKLGKPKTEVMLILANPDTALDNAMLPVDGVGLMRLEFVINNSIRVHPLALVKYDEINNKKTKKAIEKLTTGYNDKKDYFIDKLSMAVGKIAAAFYPNDVIVRMSDFKTNEYADLIGGSQFEPEEENPMVGFRGASRYYHEIYADGFALECRAMRVVREEMGMNNVKLMIPFCRTVEEGKKVQEVMAKNGLKRGEDNLEIYVMTEIPANVILGEKFGEIFDGFSIGSNDLTQLTLGIDRDSEIISGLFDENNEAVKKMISMAIEKAHSGKRKIGLCGQAPSDFPEFAKFLVENGIDSISFNPDAVIQGIENIVKAEKK